MSIRWQPCRTKFLIRNYLKNCKLILAKILEEKKRIINKFKIFNNTQTFNFVKYIIYNRFFLILY